MQNYDSISRSRRSVMPMKLRRFYVGVVLLILITFLLYLNSVLTSYFFLPDERRILVITRVCRRVYRRNVLVLREFFLRGRVVVIALRSSCSSPIRGLFSSGFFFFFGQFLNVWFVAEKPSKRRMNKNNGKIYVKFDFRHFRFRFSECSEECAGFNAMCVFILFFIPVKPR